MAINLTDTPDDDDTYPPAYRELVEPSQPTPKAIRAWALEKGLVVGKRGKLPLQHGAGTLSCRIRCPFRRLVPVRQNGADRHPYRK